MKRFVKSGLFWFIIFSALVYIVLWATLPLSVLIDLFNGLFFGIAISVAAILFPLVQRAMRSGKFDRISQLTIGMLITWISVCIMRGFSIFHRAGLAGSVSTSIVNSPWISFATWLAIMGGTLYITAPGMVGNDLRYNKKYLIISATIGILFAIAAFFFQRP